MTILSLFTHPHVVSNLYDFIYSGVTKEYILKNDSTVFVHTVKVSVVQNNYCKNFLNIFFCVPQNNEMHKGLEWHKDE